MNPARWRRINKDLYLDSSWWSAAYVFVERRHEKDLLPPDSVVVDLKMGHLDPGVGTGKIWEARKAGLWILRQPLSHADPEKILTAVDVLYGSHAIDPRPGWQLKDMALFEPQTSARLTFCRQPVAVAEKPVPRIRKDGKFKIMQVSDMHLSTGPGKCRDVFPRLRDEGKCEADDRTLKLVERLIKEEKPDLIVASGDQVNGETSPDAQTAIFKFAELFARHEIPWAAIFGNHDQISNLDNSAAMAVMSNLPYSLSQPGPLDVDGVGNYYVEVLAKGSSHSALTLYLLDTHAHHPDQKHHPGYNFVQPSQIRWFKDTSQSLREAHKEYTHIHMNLAFIHIPLPEYRKKTNEFVGSWAEPVTGPTHNSHFRDALVQENVLAVSCGHDHVNDYCMLEKNQNKSPALWMCYAGGSGFGGYAGYNNFIRRVRFFDIDMNSAQIITYTRPEYPDTSMQRDGETMIVDGGKVIASSKHVE